MRITDHRQLVVWQKGVALALETYRVSRLFPREETYGLSSQIRRAAVSIPSNVAEGNGRTHRAEYRYHLSVARGSLREVETLAEIACGLAYVREEELAPLRELLDHVGANAHPLAEAATTLAVRFPIPDSRFTLETAPVRR